jgi:thermitase
VLGRFGKLFAGLLAGAALFVAPSGGAPTASADGWSKPNDPGFSTQWGLKQTRVDQVWNTVRGNNRVIVAVLDTGVNPLPDLRTRMLPGYDFVNGDSNPADDNGHGTMAAGVVAAGGHNRTGVAGICWNCRILPVKVLNAKGSGSYTAIAQGIRFAADRGASVISLSLGGSADSSILRDAVTYAEQKGALIVAAAGNRGVSAPHYPAAIPSVLSVGGVTVTGARYSWSNYGSWVDVTAPGCNPAQGPSGAIGQYCGTSSAAPFVAGVAGLLASLPSKPTAAELRAAIIGTKSATTKRVDALRALQAL